jgi:hypothetical protein
MTYDDARPWAKAIRDEVLARRMPPWGAVKGVGEFRGDPSLSQIEIDMIVNWVEGGAPKGDDIYLPPAPHFSAEAKPQPAAREVTVTTAAALTLPRRRTGRPASGAAGGGRVARSDGVRAGRRGRAAHLDPQLAPGMAAHLLLPASGAAAEGHADRGVFGQAGG